MTRPFKSDILKLKWRDDLHLPDPLLAWPQQAEIEAQIAARAKQLGELSSQPEEVPLNPYQKLGRVVFKNLAKRIITVSVIAVVSHFIDWPQGSSQTPDDAFVNRNDPVLMIRDKNSGKMYPVDYENIFIVGDINPNYPQNLGRHQTLKRLVTTTSYPERTR